MKRPRGDATAVPAPRQIQLHLDMGQRDSGLLHCASCGMAYTRTAEDLRDHKERCATLSRQRSTLQSTALARHIASLRDAPSHTDSTPSGEETRYVLLSSDAVTSTVSDSLEALPGFCRSLNVVAAIRRRTPRDDWILRSAVQFFVATRPTIVKASEPNPAPASDSDSEGSHRSASPDPDAPVPVASRRSTAAPALTSTNVVVVATFEPHAEVAKPTSSPATTGPPEKKQLSLFGSGLGASALNAIVGSKPQANSRSRGDGSRQASSDPCLPATLEWLRRWAIYGADTPRSAVCFSTAAYAALNPISRQFVDSFAGDGGPRLVDVAVSSDSSGS